MHPAGGAFLIGSKELWVLWRISELHKSALNAQETRMRIRIQESVISPLCQQREDDRNLLSGPLPSVFGRHFQSREENNLTRQLPSKFKSECATSRGIHNFCLLDSRMYSQEYKRYILQLLKCSETPDPWCSLVWFISNQVCWLVHPCGARRDRLEVWEKLCLVRELQTTQKRSLW